MLNYEIKFNKNIISIFVKKMAFGFPPNYKETFSYSDFAKPQFLMLCLYACQELNWHIQYFSNKGLIAYTQNEDLKFHAQIKIVLEYDNIIIQSTSLGNEMFDSDKNKKTVHAFLEELELVKQKYNLEQLDENYEAIRENIIGENQDILQISSSTSLDIFKDIFSLFKPTKNYFFTPIILIVNIFVFVLMVVNGVNPIDPTTNDLINWGANFKPLTINGEWWRLFTCTFEHIGIMHLLFNMYALVYIGILLEPILGKVRFIFAYIITGISASLVSLWWTDINVSAGASGSIFGLYGIFLALLTTSIVEKSTRRPLLISMIIFIIFNLANGLKSGVDNAAHIGGLLSGIMIAYLMLPSLKNKSNLLLKYTSILLISMILLFSSFLVIKKIPNHFKQYDNLMNILNTNDMKSVTVFSLNDSIKTEDKMLKIKNEAISITKMNLLIIDSLQKLDVPQKMKYDLPRLKKYFDIRLLSFELYYKAVSENTTKYDDSLNYYYKILNSLSR